MTRRGPLAALALALALVLSACAGLPMSGTVRQGLPDGGDVGPPDFSFIPEQPQPGASPEDIVAGFVRAAAVPADGWSGARQFLTPGFRDAWRPDAGVTVDALADRAYSSPSGTTVELRTTATAAVDDTGAYATTSGGSTSMQFQLERVADGEWRIGAAPDGILLDADLFGRVYHGYDLAYFDPTWQYLVPDTRWFPTTNAATRIVNALVNGHPTPWLAGSVRTAFIEGITARPAVPVVDGVAQVELVGTALALDSVVTGRMKAQLQSSLESAGISESALTVSGTTLPATATGTRSTDIDPRPLVLDQRGFGFVSGGELEPIPGLSDAVVGASPVAVQVAADYDAAVVRRPGGEILRVRSDGGAQALDSRPDTLVPSMDPFGYVWSVAASAPDRITAYGRDGRIVDIAGAWPGSTRISGMQISRDGTRLVAAVSSGGRSRLWIAGVLRDGSGSPSGVGEAVSVTDLPGPAIALGWLDAGHVAAAAQDGPGVAAVVRTIGGLGTTSTAPASTVALAGAAVSAVRVRTADGVVSVRRGANWQEVANAVDVLGSAQGLPAR